jgi:hypothetical protein
MVEEPEAQPLDAESPPPAADEGPGPWLPNRKRRDRVESFAMRVVATAGVIGIGTALAAILAWQDVRGWIIGVAVSAVSVVLAGVLWSSRTL